MFLFPLWVFYLSAGRREERHERSGEERTGDKQSGPTPLLPPHSSPERAEEAETARDPSTLLQGSRNKKARGDVTRANLNLRRPLREFGTRDAPMRAVCHCGTHTRTYPMRRINAVSAALEFSKTRRIVFFSRPTCAETQSPWRIIIITGIAREEGR
jgi:hypothetical protein